MTLLPSDDFGITGWPGNQYKVNETCAHPGCNRLSVHAHHMWPRSFIRKDYDWVRLPDGTILGNRIGLCEEHHRMVTGEIGGYRSKLVWERGIMLWQDKVVAGQIVEQVGVAKVDTWMTMGALTTQPPVSQINGRSIAYGSDIGVAHGHVADEEKVCPTCGHHKRDPDAPRAKLERRNTKQWVVTVPDDAEIGADILDNWIEDLSIVLGFSDQSSRLRRYHCLVIALAWLSQNRSEFIADLAEAAERRVSA